MVTIKQRLKLNQNTMRKTVILLMTLTLVVTSIGAAAAKPDKPGKPDKSDELVYYDVTMELVGDSDGLSTDNCGANPIVMRLEESRSGSLLATADGAFPSDPDTSNPDLYLGAGFTDPADGCWYGAKPDPTNPEPAESDADFFRMVFDRDGALEKITWHFDVVMDGATVTHKYALTSQNKKGRNSVGVEWTDTGRTTVELTDTGGTGLVIGSFELWNYSNTEGPVWDEIGEPQQLAFTLTISPHSEDE